MGALHRRPACRCGACGARAWPWVVEAGAGLAEHTSCRRTGLFVGHALAPPGGKVLSRLGRQRGRRTAATVSLRHGVGEFSICMAQLDRPDGRMWLSGLPMV